MQPRTAPTSPAAKKEVVTRVWKSGEFQQPARTPWGRVVLLMIFLSALISISVLIGFGWYLRRYPDSWLARYAPLVTTTSTTVVQSTKEKETTLIPVAVQNVADSVYALQANQGAEGIYRPTEATGLSWPLSSSGWLLSLTGAWPAEKTSLVVIPKVGQPQAITTTVTDPASPFVFLKSTDLSNRPIQIASADDLQVGQRVWVVTAGSVISRQLVERHPVRWVSTDRLETTWALDGDVTAPIGSAVVESGGRVLGVLGSQNRVWPIEGLSAAVRSVIQTGGVERPTAGFRALNQAAAVLTGAAGATGLLVGADEGQVAVQSKGPAEKAGLRAGDVILTVDGQPVTGDCWGLVQQRRPGDELKMSVRRKTTELNLTIKLGSAHS